MIHLPWAVTVETQRRVDDRIDITVIVLIILGFPAVVSCAVLYCTVAFARHVALFSVSKCVVLRG